MRHPPGPQPSVGNPHLIRLVHSSINSHPLFSCLRSATSSVNTTPVPTQRSPKATDTGMKRIGFGLTPMVTPSVVTSKPANGGQGKTGQRRWPGTWFFYPVFT